MVSVQKEKAVEKLLKECENRNDQAMTVKYLVDSYLPGFFATPKLASRYEIDRYNSLVRSNVFDQALQRELIITY